MPIIRWPKVKKTWETIERAIREEFSLKEYTDFPDRKLAMLDYWLAQMYAIRAGLQYEIAVKEEGQPHYEGK